MRKLFLLCFLPACFIDAPTFHEADGGGDDAPIDAGVDAMPANAVLATEQAPHGFGDVTLGDMSATLEITFRNTGVDPTGEISVTLGGANPGEFDLVDAGAGDCAGKTLAADQTCVASARFAPGTAGAAAATLEVTADPGGTASVALSGNGLSPGALEITAGATLPFSTVEIQSSSAAQTLTVHNLGGTATPALETVVGAPSAYSTSNDTCHGAPLAGGASCSVDVVFNPAVVGSLPSQISVRESPSVGVAASATGTGTARLRVNMTGTGAVDSAPGGITCTTCGTTTATFSQSPVTLTASNLGNFVFDSWSGACASANPSMMCAVPLTAPLTTVGATFLEVFPLDVAITGSGGVTSSPGGIQCGGGLSDCGEGYKSGTAVTLSASPDADFEVFAWTGAPGCTVGMHMCTVTMSQARSVGVEFKRQYTVTVVHGGSGSGSITGGSINCPGTCSATLFTGSMITLTETPGTAGPNSQIVFGGWSGGTCSGGASTCQVTLDGDKSVNATFTLQHRLLVNFSGNGVGSMSGTGSFTCSAAPCTKYYDAGTVVSLLAKPANGSNSYFTGFASSPAACADGVSNSCVFTITAPQTIGPSFDTAFHNLVFVSSATYPANLGGATAYDAVCNTLATAAGINNVTNDRFIAWMSDNNSLARDRLGSAKGFVGMDHKPFFNDPSTITVNNAAILYPIIYDENGNDPGRVPYFSGTTIEGTASPHNCQNWTTLSEDPNPPKGGGGGFTHFGPEGWAGQSPMYCGQNARLLCFAKSNPFPLDPLSHWGKKMFVTNTSYVPGTNTPDAACAASKPAGVASAHAVIATTMTTAASKLDPFTLYARPDGVEIGGAAAIIAGTTRSGAWQRGNGQYTNGWLLTGSSGIDSVGIDTCDDWTNSASPNPAWSGNAANVGPNWWTQAFFRCDGTLVSLPLLCVED